MRNRCVVDPSQILPPSDWFLMWPGPFVVGVDARCDVHGLSRPFRIEYLLPDRPPGSQGSGPSQVDGTSSHDGSRSGQLGSCSSLCDGVSAMRFPCDSSSARSLSPLDGVLISRSATPCAQGANASGLAAQAVPASPVDPTPAVPSARADAAPTTGSAPPPSCVLTPEGSTSPASAFLAVQASPKGSTFSGKPGE